MPDFAEKALIFFSMKSQFLHDLVHFVCTTQESENETVSRLLTEVRDRNAAELLEYKEQQRIQT